jgi:hypothetical protein
MNSIFISLLLTLVSTFSFGQEVIHERDLVSLSKQKATLTPQESCIGGGRNLYLRATWNAPVRVGVCNFWKGPGPDGGVTYHLEFSFYRFGINSKVPQLVGCEIPGLNIYKIAWSDVDDGYQPQDLTVATSALVKQRFKNLPDPLFRVENLHAEKFVTVSYNLRNYSEMKTLRPGEDLIANSVNWATYVSPYMNPLPGSNCK